MHAYASNDRDTSSVVVALAVLSAVSAYGLYKAFERLFGAPPWWVDMPSVLAFLGAYYRLYDKVIWKWKRSSTMPDISGTWAGSLKSSHDQMTTDRQFVAVIYQSWTEISVKIETDSSRSFSTMAALNAPSSQEPGLKYEYLNEPKASAGGVTPHRGTTHLRLSPSGEEMDGEYYNGPARFNHGSMRIVRVSRGILSFADAQKVPRTAKGTP